MSAAQNKDLATVPPSGAMSPRPDFFQEGDRRGTEHITREDLQLPRLGLAQALSPEVQEIEAKYIPGLAAGDIFNNLSKFNFKRGPVFFTVVRADKPRWVEFNPREEGGGIKDMDVPHDDPRTRFTTDPETHKSMPPAATKFYDFIVLLLPGGAVPPDLPVEQRVVALSFKSTGLKIARQLNALMSLRNAPSFLGRYALGSAQERNSKGTYFVFTVANADWVTKEEFQYAEQLFNSVKDKVLNVEREPGSDDFIEGETTTGSM